MTVGHTASSLRPQILYSTFSFSFMCLSVDLCRPRFVVLITPTPALVISHNSRQPRCKEHPKKAAVAPEIRLTRERKDVIAAVGQSVKKCDSAVGFASPRGHPCSMLGPTKHSRPRQKKVSRMVGIGQRFKGTAISSSTH
ncbi:hypothetical protein PISMIDRAFT_563721 [Pisolithus microcarpus 441]|uniref:Uncharacterized protein n=1 Tax=Pisolithus microcarpus 441 TaxID=765257 RepID=A0A0C9YKI3_9AGAM|nr:hypothetical protein PISMIDRAFT_563721 [Pisolithus microcarpus 441]